MLCKLLANKGSKTRMYIYYLYGTSVSVIYRSSSPTCVNAKIRCAQDSRDGICTAACGKALAQNQSTVHLESKDGGNIAASIRAICRDEFCPKIAPTKLSLQTVSTWLLLRPVAIMRVTLSVYGFLGWILFTTTCMGRAHSVWLREYFFSYTATMQLPPCFINPIACFLAALRGNS